MKDEMRWCRVKSNEMGWYVVRKSDIKLDKLRWDNKERRRRHGQDSWWGEVRWI